MSPIRNISAHIKAFFSPQRDDDIRRVILAALRWIILILSIALIVFISIDIYNKVDFIHNAFYMKFQYWVCMVFIADFFIELLLTPVAAAHLICAGAGSTSSSPYPTSP